MELGSCQNSESARLMNWNEENGIKRKIEYVPDKVYYSVEIKFTLFIFLIKN